MFWPWLLKYSSIFITGIVTLVVGYLLHKLTSRHADLIYYMSHPQLVMLPPPQGQTTPPALVGTFTLFLWNPGKAPAREVHVGHYSLPPNNVFPDIPREIVKTPGGGEAIRFPTVPPKALISISYLFFGPYSVEQIVSYVGWEGGGAKRIPVMLQRVWPKWWLAILQVTLLAGLWVIINVIVGLIEILWAKYYVM